MPAITGTVLMNMGKQLLKNMTKKAVKGTAKKAVKSIVKKKKVKGKDIPLSTESATSAVE